MEDIEHQQQQPAQRVVTADDAAVDEPMRVDEEDVSREPEKSSKEEQQEPQPQLEIAITLAPPHIASETSGTQVVATPSVAAKATAPLIYTSRCFACGKQLEQIKACSKCRITVYCSQQCQSTDWKLKHRTQCATISKYLNLAESPLRQARFVWYDVTWGTMAIATRRIVRGEFIMSITPMLTLVRHGTVVMREKFNDWQRRSLVGAIDDHNNIKEKSWACLDEPSIFGRAELPGTDQSLAEGVRKLSMEGRLTLMLLGSHPELVASHCFSTKLFGEKKEYNDIETLYAYVATYVSKDVSRDFIVDAYAMVRQCSHYVFDNIRQEYPSALVFDPVLAKINHSCKPNAHLVFSNGELLLMANADIANNEQITIDYFLQNSFMLEFKKRREILMEQRHFECECHRCLAESSGLVPDVFLAEEYRHPPKVPEGTDAMPVDESSKLISSYVSAALPQWMRDMFESAAVTESSDNLKLMIMELASVHETAMRTKDVHALSSDQRCLLLDAMVQRHWSLLGAVTYELMRYELSRQSEHRDKAVATLQNGKQMKLDAVKPWKIDLAEAKYGFDGCRHLYMYLVELVLGYIGDRQQKLEEDLFRSLQKLVMLYHVMRVFLLIHPHLATLDQLEKAASRSELALLNHTPDTDFNKPDFLKEKVTIWYNTVCPLFSAGEFNALLDSCEWLFANNIMINYEGTPDGSPAIIFHRLLSMDQASDPALFLPYARFIGNMERCKNVCALIDYRNTLSEEYARRGLVV